MEICSGYDKECSCEGCHDRRCEEVRRHTEELKVILESHMTKLQSEIQPERSKREDSSFVRKIINRIRDAVL